MSRKVAREFAFKTVFEMLFQSGEDADELIDELIDNEEEKPDISSEDKIYYSDVVNGIKNNLENIDKYIKDNLKDGWTMNRICKTDIAILRVAIYEIMYREDIPYKVSINEAVELAKLYCENSSPSFINGVLAEVVKGLNSEV